MALTAPDRDPLAAAAVDDVDDDAGDNIRKACRVYNSLICSRIMSKNTPCDTPAFLLPQQL